MATSKSTSSPTSARKAVHGGSEKTARKPVKAKLINTGITPDQRSQMIAEAAYYRAERRGFNPEGQVDDWLEAENMIDEMISHSAEPASAHRH